MTEVLSPPVPAPTASARPRAAARSGRAIGVGLVLGSACSVHSGAAVATLLFPRAGVGGVVALRLTLAAVLLLVLCRPRLRGYTRADWALIVGFGVVLATMNTVFYQAIERVPLGPAVTIEVLGPLTLSVIAARRAAGWMWALLALAGVALLGWSDLGQLDLIGVALCLTAGALWAGYILLSARTGGRFPKADGLALALAVAALVSLPVGVLTSGAVLLDPTTLGLGAAVAALSTMVPYTMELSALRRLPTATFSLLMSLGPAIAALAGFAILGQGLTVAQGGAIALVVIASAGAVHAARSLHNGPTPQGGIE
jgi:inner membrane transporter RhtA